MSSLSTLPKGDSAWLLRKSIQRIMQQVSVLETNIGSSTTGNSADTQVIFNDAGTLRGDTGLTYDKSADRLSFGAGICYGLLTSASATITGDLTVDTSTLKVDSANNRVGIGIDTPAWPLDIRSATAVAQILSTTGTNEAYLQFSNTGGIFYLGRENSAGTSFASPAYSAVLYAGGAYPLVTTVNGSERYRIASDGVATWSNVGGVAGTAMTLNATGLGVGVVPSAGKGALQLSSGITFPATAVASADANTLDDYEEGTWTIGLTFGGGNTGLTTALNTGRYTKIGRQVTVSGRLELSNKGSSTGAAVITGLPFSIANTNDAQQAASFRCNGVSYTGAFQGYGTAGSTTIPLEQISEAGSNTNLTDSNFVNGTSIQISLTYTV